MKKTKIICTMGPNADKRETLKALVENGMDIARFNFSHGDHEEQKARFDLLKSVRDEMKKPIAILLDTKGPEIRTGLLENGGKVVLKEGEEFILTSKEIKGDEIAAEDLIQEGNVGLLMAMESLNEFENAAASQAHLLNSVNEAMQAAIHANEETKKRNEDVVSQVNHLDEAIKNLERDLERKVSAEELSAYLDMPLEQIRDILNISGDQIEVDGRK